MTLTVDHLGIAVRSLQESVPKWEAALGVNASPVELVASQKVHVRFLAAGETRLEFLEPASPESVIARFVEKRGEGMHHVAFHVPSVADKLAELRAQGHRLIDEAPRPGAGGRLVAFVHPSALAGVLTELVEGDHPP